MNYSYEQAKEKKKENGTDLSRWPGTLGGNLLGLACVLIFVILPCIVSGQKVIINIDGNWSPWSTVATPCNASCGGGVQTKVRSCTNPRPQGMKAKDCEGPANKYFQCNLEPCDMQWSSWSNCSANCGRGLRLRYTKCAIERGGRLYDCSGDQYFTHTDNCNSWNRSACVSPCEGYDCMEFAACRDVSTDEDPLAICECQLGKSYDKDTGLTCVDPPPTTPTPRPIPTLQPEVKAATTGLTKTASTILIVFVVITLVLFGVLRIFDNARVIQMNMEISLVLAHLCILFSPEPEWDIELCRIFSILIHLFFTTCFVFMFLEALHTYSLVAFVVKKNGLLTKTQNVLTGWGSGLGIILLIVSKEYKNYGGEYHCWLQMDTTLMIGQYIPIVLLVVLTLTLIEAAGAAEYRKLPGVDQRQQMSAKIMQRSNLIIMPMVFASFVLGTLSSFEQNVPLYGSFTLVNGINGVCIFFFHCTGNEQVRAKLMRAYKTIIKKEKF